MRKIVFGLALGAMLFALSVFAEAQQPTKIPRIGYVSGSGDASNQGPYVEALRQGLRDLGYVEGKGFVIEYRGSEGNLDRIPSLVNELVQLKVDVLVVPILSAARAAKQATKTIPIVMVTGDPVAAGVVDSLARPGGNLTGLATLNQISAVSGCNCFLRPFHRYLASAFFGIQMTQAQLLKNTRLQYVLSRYSFNR